MDNIFRGEAVLKEDFVSKLSELQDIIQRDLRLEPLMPQVVIEAAHKLCMEIDQQEVVQQLEALGIPTWASREYVQVTINSLSREALQLKLQAELGKNPFIWKAAGEGIEEKEQSLGVLMHIGAGNALGLSAFSVLEGLLTGNINILKLPENEGGLSSRILLRLAEIEPRLKPYIYVLDVSSRENEIIYKLIEMADAVTIWGSDEAISAIRQLVPPFIPVIEWGHRLSFAYFTEKSDNESDLEELAKEVCLTDQLYCSSPQCVFFEIDSKAELQGFAEKLAKQLQYMSVQFPSAVRPIDVQAQITMTQELIKMEEILGEKRLITDKARQYSIMMDYKPELKPSPLFRNIWVMPVKREKLLGLLRKHRGHLQTVGLSCKKEELDELSGIFFAAGINRITKCGQMSLNYLGEPHDGSYALSRYVRIVNRRL
jgi:hypothetical protein